MGIDLGIDLLFHLITSGPSVHNKISDSELIFQLFRLWQPLHLATVHPASHHLAHPWVIKHVLNTSCHRQFAILLLIEVQYYCDTCPESSESAKPSLSP